MERNRQKPVGWDKGSLTEQQTKGAQNHSSNNNGTDREYTKQNRPQRELLSPPAAAVRS